MEESVQLKRFLENLEEEERNEEVCEVEGKRRKTILITQKEFEELVLVNERAKELMNK